MTPADRKAFAVLVKDALAYYRQEATTFTLDVWWGACQRFDLEQVTTAIHRHAVDPERGQFAPKVADIVRQLQGTHTDRSLVAWGKVLDSASRVGAYSSVTFDDPVIHLAIEDLGGWITVCRTNTDELPHLQRRFCDSYRAHAARGVTEFPAQLQGAHALELAGTKWADAAPAPVLIGDATRAQQVLTGGGGARVAITHVSKALPQGRPAPALLRPPAARGDDEATP